VVSAVRLTGVDRGQERHFIGGPQPALYAVRFDRDRDSHLIGAEPTAHRRGRLHSSSPA